MLKCRYRLYREHKYVCFIWSELECLIAKTDFRDDTQLEIVKQQLSMLHAMMRGHAEHEETAIHPLLRQKGSSLYESIETDHKNHEPQFKKLEKMLTEIANNTNAQERISLGYNFYLSYRQFECDNLKHINDEETIIMPELQRLYSDDELRAIDANVYSQMTPEQMIEMIEILLPHINSDDLAHFLADIEIAEPEKFKIMSKNVVTIVGTQ